jgi:hypothetical protein
MTFNLGVVGSSPTGLTKFTMRSETYRYDVRAEVCSLQNGLQNSGNCKLPSQPRFALVSRGLGVADARRTTLVLEAAASMASPASVPAKATSVRRGR